MVDIESYNSFETGPDVNVQGCRDQIWSGWSSIAQQLQASLSRRSTPAPVVTVECYRGVFVEQVANKLDQQCSFERILFARDAYHPPERINELVKPFLGGDDPVFGYMSNLTIEQFMDPERKREFNETIRSIDSEPVLVIGTGATLLHEPDLLIYADMPRREIQLRQRNDRVANLGMDNHESDPSRQYKRSFFIDWRVADRYKKEVFPDVDYLLDTTEPDDPKMITEDALQAGLDQTVEQPFSLVPFFDPGVWGGEWMRSAFDLNEDPQNFAWCFNCVPEENSLLLDYGDTSIEIPSINLVFFRPQELMGPHVYSLFGFEFPIRFDYLDTMDGQNLSLQVHPLMDQIQDEFGMHYTQDESYYMMDAEEGGTVYLGLKEDVDPDEMKNALERARDVDEETFDAGKYVNEWNVEKHDHLSIPAGTVHCSGAGSLVLEISATPYIFTFKLWDWDRVDLDGNPRPINVERGKQAIQWDRRTEWVQEELINPVETVDEGNGWTEERTGLHELEFIETRRHWFTDRVPHDTDGTVHVLNLVEGKEVIVEDPDGEFDPFLVHYGETFIVPARVGSYTIRPHGPSEGDECATIKAYVR